MELPDGVRMRLEILFSEQIERLDAADAEVVAGRLKGRVTLVGLEPVAGAYRFLIQPNPSQPATLPAHVLRGLHRFARDETVRVGSEEEAKKDKERIRDGLIAAIRDSAGALDAFGRRIEEAEDRTALPKEAEALAAKIRETALAAYGRRAYFLYDYHHMAAHAFEDFGGVAARLAENVRAPEAATAIRAALQRRVDLYVGRLGIPVRNDELGREALDALERHLAAAKPGDVPDDVKRVLLDLTWLFPNDFDTVKELTEAVHAVFGETAGPDAAADAVKRLRTRIP